MSNLVARGAVASSAANALNLLPAKLTARQAADRCSAAVFLLDTYSSQLYVDAATPTGAASGFFISSDGLAVTNYHSIKGDIRAVATLSTGEQYAVERVLYYDPDIDIAVIRVSMRQPFPGPGLAIRVIGEITREKLDILRDADFVFRDELHKEGADAALSQYFAVLTSMRSVGVMGDGRTYDYTLALRAVTTTDFMTADWARIPYDVLDRVSTRIVNEVGSINRIVYDITSKPPATIEWE